jgi:uncharacterized tellurite resistance protein B-like protein
LRDSLIQSGQVASQGNPTETTEARSNASLKRFAPFAETMYLMMMIDGDADQSELNVIRGAISILTDGMLDSDSLDEIFERCAEVAANHGVEERLQYIGAHLSADKLDRETAFTLAAAVAIADNEVAEEEAELVRLIAEWYGISESRCEEILQQI